MKTVKKLLSMIMVFLLAFALVVPVSASDKVKPENNPEIDPSITTGTITINKEGSIFSVYKILNATAKKGQNVYTYTVNDNFTGLIGEGKECKYKLEDIGDMPNQFNINQYDEEGNLIKVNDPITEETSKFTTDVQKYIETNSIEPVATISVNDSEETKVTLDIGFYIVIETGTSSDSASVASKSMLVPIPFVDDKGWNYDLEITPKDEPVKIDKSILEGDEKNKVNISTNNVGDILRYQVDADIPHYDASTNTQMVKYVITDTLSKGLDFYTKKDPENKNNIDIVVSDFSGGTKVLEPGTLEVHEAQINGESYTYYSVSDGDYAVNYEGKTMIIIFDYPDIMAYNDLQLNYSVKINDSAVIGVEGNPNQVDLEYTNNNKTWNTSRPEDKTITYTYGLKINKVDEKTSKPLAGAEFQLSDEKGEVVETYTFNENGLLVLNSDDGKTAVTGSDGIAYLIGFKAGTYTLKETKAPNGYILPDGQMTLKVTETKGTNDEGKEVVIGVTYTLIKADGTKYELTVEDVGGESVADGSVAVTTIMNNPGINLPKTGGAGTWMFTVGGILIMAGMATAFVKLRKKEN